VTCSVSRVNRDPCPGSATGSVNVTRALVLPHVVPSAQGMAQRRQETRPVAVARCAVQLVQASCSAISPSSAQVRIMLIGRMAAGPWPQSSTAAEACGEVWLARPAAREAGAWVTPTVMTAATRLKAVDDL
jgi:hypothetical protein